MYEERYCLGGISNDGTLPHHMPLLAVTSVCGCTPKRSKYQWLGQTKQADEMTQSLHLMGIQRLQACMEGMYVPSANHCHTCNRQCGRMQQAVGNRQHESRKIVQTQTVQWDSPSMNGWVRKGYDFFTVFMQTAFIVSSAVEHFYIRIHCTYHYTAEYKQFTAMVQCSTMKVFHQVHTRILVHFLFT